MVRVARILKDFRETGALNSLIALWGFVDETTFLTKAGAVGVLYRLQGVDFECLDHPQRQAIVHGLEQALRQLDESFRVYQYLIKRPAPVVAAAPHPHPVVEEAVALAIPDQEIGNTIRAIVTLSDSRSLTSPELKRHCAEKLPPYMIPEEIEFRDSLPRTGNGKIDRQRLQRERLALNNLTR